MRGVIYSIWKGNLVWGEMMQLLVISGGRHPYQETTPVLEGFLVGAGHTVAVTEDASVLADGVAMTEFDAVVLNTRRENLPDFGDWALSGAEWEGLKRFVMSGRGFVCLHIAGCAAADWPEFDDITGGGWITGVSYHPPYGEMLVRVDNPAHVGVVGVSDFVTRDELYMGIRFREGNDVFLTGDAEDGTWPWGAERAPVFMAGGTFPLAWTRGYGRGRVFVLLLGHDGGVLGQRGFSRWC